MRIILDSNILFTYFWENSCFREILRNPDLEFFSPQYALKEIAKYSDMIIKKTNISQAKYRELKAELIDKVCFVSLDDYKREIVKLAKGIDIDDEIVDDLDFLALAFALKCPLWSNDKHLKSQELVTVLSTEEIVTLI